MKKKSKTLEQKVDGLTTTMDHLAISVAKGFERIDKRFDSMDKRFDRINKRFDDVDFRLSKIEANHERRIDILEDRMQVIKTYFERNPKLKVKF